jgi:uncharacterized protein (TIGR02271 family)
MTRTLTALYDTRDHAEQARQDLIDAGVPSQDVNISAADHAGGGESQTSDSASGGFMQSVKNFFMPEQDHHAYSEGLRRGGVLLTVHAAEGREDRVMQILDTSGAVDLDAREQEWRGAGWQGADATPETLRQGEDTTIPIAEERLQVGKREVDRGTVRVRSYVTERPVNEQVTLREEHVDVERRPVNERLTGAQEGLFEERSFEVSERGEEAVVSKEAVVTDELHVTKHADQRTETIQDTVRRTEVDVDDQRGGAHQTRSPDQPRGY